MWRVSTLTLGALVRYDRSEWLSDSIILGVSVQIKGFWSFLFQLLNWLQDSDSDRSLETLGFWFSWATIPSFLLLISSKMRPFALASCKRGHKSRGGCKFCSTVGFSPLTLRIVKGSSLSHCIYLRSRKVEGKELRLILKSETKHVPSTYVTQMTEFSLFSKNSFLWLCHKLVYSVTCTRGSRILWTRKRERW